jgi:hypothetical protein
MLLHGLNPSLEELLMIDYRVGDIYFVIWFHDEERLYPYFESAVFVGKNIEDEQQDGEFWYFQDLESYLQELPQHKAPGDVAVEGRLYCMRREDLELVAEDQGRITDSAGLTAALARWRTRVDEAKNTGKWP